MTISMAYKGFLSVEKLAADIISTQDHFIMMSVFVERIVNQALYKGFIVVTSWFRKP